MPKPKVFIERHFNKLPPVPNAKMDHYTCKYCISEYAYHSTWMIGHLLIFKSCPGAIKSQAAATKDKASRKNRNTRNYLALPGQSMMKAGNQEKIISNIEQQNTKNSNENEFEPLKLDQFVFKLDKNTQLMYQKALAEAIFVSGKLLHCFKQKNFKKIFC